MMIMTGSVVRFEAFSSSLVVALADYAVIDS